MKKIALTIISVLLFVLLTGSAAVAYSPVASVKSGVYDDVESILVELKSDGGEIHYTLDGNKPDIDSPLYSTPFELTETTVIRAICFKEGYAESRVSTYNYIINEGHELPVLCLNVDRFGPFKEQYAIGGKGKERAATLALYEDGKQVFSRACGVDLRGGAALYDAKKTLGVWFRSEYGDGKLRNIDLFGTGKDNYKSLVIRAGQDYHGCVIRDSLCGALCAAIGDNVPVQNSKYCVLYINGKYYGIHCLKEHMNYSYFANLDGVDRDDVKILKATETYAGLYQDEEFSNDLSLKRDYEDFCKEFDIDNLMDYLIIEGYCGNWDLKENVRFYKSSANDGKWRAYFFDGDKAFYGRKHTFKNILTDGGNSVYKVQSLFNTLLANDEFSEKILARYDDLIEGVLSDENVLAEIDRQTALIESEIPRDFERWGLNPEQWYKCIDDLKAMIEGDGTQSFADYSKSALEKYIAEAKRNRA